jgi:hypothetical protein
MMGRQVTWFALLTLAALLSAAFAACSFGGSEKENALSEPEATTASAPSQSVFVRTCEASVRGTIDDPAWQMHSVIAGPLVFYSVDQYAGQPASAFAPIPGRDGTTQGKSCSFSSAVVRSPPSSCRNQTEATRRSSTTPLPGTTATRTRSRTGRAP